MIIDFQFENWACYRGVTTLSMQAGPERDADSRLANFGTDARPEKLLPVAAVYGNNASGKTQLVKAIDFLRHFAIGDYSRRELPYQPYLLDAKAAGLPTRFVLQFLAEETVFEYEVKLLRGRVEMESLSSYSSRGLNRHELFIRNFADVRISEEWGGDALRAYSRSLKASRTQCILALSHELCRESPLVRTVYDWFANRLFVITPNLHYSGLEDFCTHGAMEKKTVECLDKFDIGIRGFATKEIDASALPSELQDELMQRLRAGRGVRVQNGAECFWVCKTPNGQLKAHKVFALHNRRGGGRVPFAMERESDGTRRMLDLIPAFSNLEHSQSRNVYVVDELDRSLHHAVTRSFVREFIDSCSPGSRSQLIFTTHDVMLMDQDLLRRDSMYIVDKSPDGESSLTDVRQFRGLRRSTNIRDKYLEGRLGGIAMEIV